MFEIFSKVADMNSISAKNLNIFFFLKVKAFFFLKSSELYLKNFSLKSDEKKNWPHFSHFKSTISQKLIIGKLFFFGFSFFSIHNPSFRIIKSPLRIIKSKQLFLRVRPPLTLKKSCFVLTRKEP